MPMEVNSSYKDDPKEYLERLQKEQERTGENGKEQKTENRKESIPVPKDEYISSEKSGTRPSGLYRIGKDENGNPKVQYEDPKKSGSPKAQCEGPKKSDSSRAPYEDPGKSAKLRYETPKEITGAGDKEKPKAGAGSPEDTEECTVNTDQVDQEIKRLKEQKQQLEQQIRAASADAEKRKELERKLSRIENELRKKDNDAYRRQNAVIS